MPSTIARSDDYGHTKKEFEQRAKRLGIGGKGAARPQRGVSRAAA